MASNSGWDKTIPSDTSLVAQGDDDIRSFKSHMQAWWEDEHYATDGSSSSAGEHKPGSGRAYVGALSALSSPKVGRFFWDTTNGQLYVAPSSSSWSQVAGVAADSRNTFTAFQAFESGLSTSRLSIGADVAVYRDSANVLKTDDTVEVANLIVGGGKTIKSVKTAIGIIPDQTVAGGESAGTTLTATGAAVGDVAFASTQTRPGENTFGKLDGARVSANAIHVSISNGSTGNLSFSTTTVHVVWFDVT